MTKTKKYLIKNIPFYNQMTLPDWEAKGFKSKEEALLWDRKACGISCAQMIGEGLAGQKTRFGELINEGCKFGAYLEGKGWIHAKLGEFIAERFGLKSEAFRGIDINHLKKAIESGKLLIASVGLGFKDAKSGHLILILGGEVVSGKLTGLYVHHPSSRPELCMAEKYIPIDVFENSFSGNSIEISKNK